MVIAPELEHKEYLDGQEPIPFNGMGLRNGQLNVSF